MFGWLAKEAAKRVGGSKIVKRFGEAITKRTSTPKTTVVQSTSPSRVMPTSTSSVRMRTPAETPLPGVRITQKMVKSGAASPEEYALNRAAQLAAREEAKAKKAADAARKSATKTTAKTPTTPKPEAPATPRTSRIPGAVKGTANLVGQTAAFSAPGVINQMQAEGKNVPGWVEAAANAAALATTGAAAKSAFSSIASKTGRETLKNASKLTKALTALGAAGATYGVTQVPTFVRNIFGAGNEVPAIADTEMQDTQTINPADVFPEEIALEEGALSPEEQYLAEIQSAIDALIANAEAQASQEMSAIDQEYQAEQDAIRADYESRRQQIAGNYEAALGQIAAYQDQADQLLASAAAAAQAGYEQAAGGLQNVQVPTGLTGDEAALSGISPTALGGAAISGAALSRGLAGAEQAAAAAQRFRTGVDLGGQLAETRGDQADALTALERGLLESETLARMSAADRRAAARKERAAVKDEAVRLEANAKMTVAEKVSNMTPAQLAAWRGSAASKKQFVAPSWFGINVSGPSATPIKGLTLAETPATVGSLNDALDRVSAAMTDPAYTDPSTALAAWTLFFEEVSPDDRKLLEYKKVPSSAGAMYSALFKTAPTK